MKPKERSSFQQSSRTEVITKSVVCFFSTYCNMLDEVELPCGRVCLLCLNISRFMKPDFTNGSREPSVSPKACYHKASRLYTIKNEKFEDCYTNSSTFHPECRLWAASWWVQSWDATSAAAHPQAWARVRSWLELHSPCQRSGLKAKPWSHLGSVLDCSLCGV